MVVDSAGRRHVFYIEYSKGLYHLLASTIAPPPSVQPDADTLIFQDGRQYTGGGTYAGTLDAHILESSPLNNTGNHITLEAARTNGLDPAADRSIVIRFDDLDTSTQAGRFLQQATLTLNYFGSRNDPGGVHKTLSIHRLLQDWGEGVQTEIDGAFANNGEACWDKPFGSSTDNNPPWAGTLTYGMADPVTLDSVALGGPEDYGPVQFNVTSAVRRQLLGQVSNFGLVIRETTGSESTNDGTRQFDSSEAVNILDRPSLTLIFTAPARGDFDLDGDIDLDDFAHLQACLTGRNVAQQNDACQNARLDADTDVDTDDVTLLRACLRGAGVPPDPGCNP
jgi:hypothetical protein